MQAISAHGDRRLPAGPGPLLVRHPDFAVLDGLICLGAHTGRAAVAVRERADAIYDVALDEPLGVRCAPRAADDLEVPIDP